ncbi:MAG: DUF4007 family protein [Verrucomicrobiia bacterium]
MFASVDPRYFIAVDGFKGDKHCTMTQAGENVTAEAQQPNQRAVPAVRSGSNSDLGFRFSGHQTFPLRMAWIPKAVSAISEKKDPLTNTDEGITTLGLGKNMVEALRCWIEAFRIAERKNAQWALTRIGDLVFHPKHGVDPYFEDISTSWLLHWLISTDRSAPFFAWECVFNRWPATEFSCSQVLEAFRKEAGKAPKPVSDVTLRQHWDVFLHTYRPARNSKGEDHLDSALAVLRLVREVGERADASGTWEALYSFDLANKTTVSRELFAFFLHDWWNETFPDEATVPLREIVLRERSPGRVLKMQEQEVLRRLGQLASTQRNVFQIVESSSLRQLRRLQARDGLDDLRATYAAPTYG